MNRLLRSILLLSVAVSGALYAQPPESDYPTFDPSLEQYSGIASQLLAEEIRTTYGGGAWNDSLLIEFSFVRYSEEGNELERYQNVWNRFTDEAFLAGTLDDGRSYRVEFSSFSKRQGTMYIDSVEIQEAQKPAALEYAYDRLATNLRFLLTPVRLLEDEVRLRLLGDTTIGGKPLTPLKVTFPDSMSTSSEILLFISPAYHNIDRWVVEYEGRKTEYVQRMSRRVGAFLIPTRHWKEDFSGFVQLENIAFIPVDSTASRRLGDSAEDTAENGG